MLAEEYLKRSANPEVDPLMVDQMVAAMSSGLERSCIPNLTTTNEILTAITTLLDKILQGVRRNESAEDHAYNAEEVSRILGDLIMEYGLPLN